MSQTPDSHLLREIDVLRACLADCLQRLDGVERQIDARPDRSERAFAPTSAADPFEWALPTAGGDGVPVHPPQPAAPRGDGASGGFTIHAVPLPHDAVAETAPSCPDASEAFTETLHDTDWDDRRTGGDGSPDPFAFVHVPLILPDSEAASDLYRGMDALLGGLDVTPPDDVS